MSVSGWFAYTKLKKRKEFTLSSEGSGNSLSNSESSSSSGYLSVKTTFPMSKGSKGDLVAELQRELNKIKNKTFATLTVDGIWGTKTQLAMDSMFSTPYTLELFRTIKDEQAYNFMLKLIKDKQ